MEIINLQSPIPRQHERAYREFIYPIVRREYLAKPDKVESRNLFETILSRRTVREFGTLGASLLSSILWYSFHVKSCIKTEGQIVLQKRPVPSAGGRYPIDLLIVSVLEKKWRVNVYDPFAHCLCLLKISEEDIENFILMVEDVVPIQQATIVWFIAQPDKIMSKYKNGESLIWRDAGVLQGHLSLLAEGLNLSSCLLGITGDIAINALLQSNGDLMGLGGCLIGGRLTEK